MSERILTRLIRTTLGLRSSLGVERSHGKSDPKRVRQNAVRVVLDVLGLPTSSSLLATASSLLLTTLIMPVYPG